MTSVWVCVVMKGLFTLRLYWRSWVVGFMSPFNSCSVKSTLYIYTVYLYIYRIDVYHVLCQKLRNVTENVALFSIYLLFSLVGPLNSFLIMQNFLCITAMLLQYNKLYKLMLHTGPYISFSASTATLRQV